MKKIICSVLLALPALPAAAGIVGCLYDAGGQVEVRRSGTQDWKLARKGLELAEGDAVRTGVNAWGELLFKDGTFVKLDASSETSADELKAGAQERAFSFSFLRGKALWMAAKVRGAVTSKFSVRTPAAVCAVRGTDFSMVVSTSGETSVGLFEGKVALSGPGGEKELLAGGEANASLGQIAVQARLSRLMQAEQRRYARVKGRVDALRKRMEQREAFIDDYISRQDKALLELEKRRDERLKKR
jgi:hypothetical protein